MRRVSFAAALCALACNAVVLSLAQTEAVPGVPVSVVVTAEARRGGTVPTLTQSDVSVREAGADRQITGLSHLRDEAGLQLLLLIDDSSGSSLNTQIGELKQWITSLPSSAEVGIGYMRNGMAEMTSKFTTDHAAAAHSLRLPLGAGGADVSPYDSLSDAVKKWPHSDAARKEVVMISSGLEGLGGGWAPENPYVNKGIADALRAGVVVFTIYNPSVGHAGHTLWRTSMGQDFLSQLSDETGGESYINTFSAPVSLSPFLDDISKRFGNQYLLTFVAAAENKAGLQPLKISVSEKDADVAAPTQVFVKASK